MGYFLLKTFITALIVAGISELSRRYSLMAALLASLPLTSILALVWIYTDSKDTQKIIAMSYDIFWLVIPSLAFFLLLPSLLKLNVQFAPALLLSCAATAVLYGMSLWVYRFLS
jgi:hypothetical protein